MYQLMVFEAGLVVPIRSLTVPRATEVAREVGRLFDAHPAAERVEVRSQNTRLYSVDRAGVRTPA